MVSKSSNVWKNESSQQSPEAMVRRKVPRIGKICGERLGIFHFLIDVYLDELSNVFR